MAKSIIDTMPLVSICVPAYNSQKYIRETLDCLCTQTYRNLEIIVVNDGSTDDTEAIVKSINDERVTLLNEPNGGAAKARNTAYHKANGKYIIFFDADDHIERDFITQQINRINGRKDVVVMALWGRFYNDDLSTFKLNDTPVNEMTFNEWVKFYWYNCNPMTNPGRAIIPVPLIKKAGGWDEELNLYDDLEFFTRIFLQAEKIIFNKNVNLYYRSGVNGLSGIKSPGAYNSSFNAIALSINSVLSAFPHDALLLKSCANMWQLFAYEAFPHNISLFEKACENIKQLQGSDVKYPCGGYTKLLVNIIGWKNTKLLKSYL